MDELTHFRVDIRGETHVLHFADRHLLDRGLLTTMQDELIEYVGSAQPASLVLSFSAVELLSSEAVNSLLQVRKKMAGYGGRLQLSDMQQEVYKLFNILKLDGTVFGIYPSTAHALTAGG